MVSIVFIMYNADKVFGKMKGISDPIAMLMLFVLSAAITGSLVIGRPILLYLDGLKKEAVKMFLFTVGFMFAITVIVFAVKILK